MTVSTYQHRGYEIRKARRSRPKKIPGKRYCAGYTYTNEFSVHVEFVDGRYARYATHYSRTLKGLRVWLDENIDAGLISDLET